MELTWKEGGRGTIAKNFIHEVSCNQEAALFERFEGKDES